MPRRAQGPVGALSPGNRVLPGAVWRPKRLSPRGLSAARGSLVSSQEDSYYLQCSPLVYTRPSLKSRGDGALHVSDTRTRLPELLGLSGKKAEAPSA
ncbi:hypothetical protein CBM2592_A190033 [Cupriavidus taiwanensis]|nr:hypothetical protein CBM2592_A190033 [Cupriavidus taiwanensis]SOY83057.1 hypothetical protein CBM2591_A230035 [Cupriavidus taiwanensis]SOZ56253.1 hypothetical protein CBM2617_A200040 [Cupriavidus taiwanensis]SOZ78827.1 hypothetical protein CBM2618_A180042 [Cupriavidus taiwanensis]SOZ79103.1 hypothetical protein CBM2622_A170040 [Cupriavidus taiwanensis]